MKNWLITGGVGCGKSLFSQILFSRLNVTAEYFSSDLIVSALLETKGVIDQIVDEVGEEVISICDHRRVIDKQALRECLFSYPTKRANVEAILHPLVLEKLDSSRSEMLACDRELFLAEVPLHYEIGETVTADLVIVVAASRTVQVRRLMERRGLEKPIIEQILRSQWPIEAKVEKADVIIWNDGDEAALEAQVMTLLRQHWHDTTHRNN